MKITIPSEFKVGFVERRDTFSGKLGYMIYMNKPDGTYGQEKSYESWRNKFIPEKFLKNDYQLGFVLNKGRLNHYRFGSSAKFRVFHPEGFEFEISLENLSLILSYTNISAGEINVPCCIGWYGKNCYLMPQIDLSKEIQVEHQNISEKKEQAEEKKKIKVNNNKPIPKRSLVGGRIVENTKGERFYISKMTYTNRYDLLLTPKFLGKDNNVVPCTPDAPTLMYSLTKFCQKVSEDDVFIKFVEKKDLTVDEQNFLTKYLLEDVIVFEKNKVLKPFKFLTEYIKQSYVMLNSGLKKNRYDNKYEVIYPYFVKSKLNGAVYSVGVNIYGFFRGGYGSSSNYIFKTSENVSLTNALNRSLCAFEFLPIASLNKDNHFYEGKAFLMSNELSMQDYEKLFRENFEELTPEEVQLLNERVLRVNSEN